MVPLSRWLKKWLKLIAGVVGCGLAFLYVFDCLIEGQWIRSNRNSSDGEARGDNSVRGNALRPTQLCPSEPFDLVGQVKCNCSHISPETLKVYEPDVEMGGRIRPKDCLARQRTAIIIPFKDRYWHLHTLLNNLIPFLKRQQADVTFFVVEQISPTMFNRATLHNIGFLEALKLDPNFDCFIFQDVDLVPLNDNLLYRCDPNPRHFAVSIKRYGYRTPRKMFEGYFGGVVALSRDQYLKINGNSNLYFGWGGEDDDILERIIHQKYKRIKEDETLAVYEMLRHERNDKKRGNVDRMIMLRTAKKRMFVEGLNTTIYNVNRIRKETFYTWIEASINMTHILLNAPEYTRRAITSMLELIPNQTVTHVH